MQETERNPYGPPQVPLRPPPPRMPRDGPFSERLVKAVLICGIYTFGGLCCGVFTGMIAFSLAAAMDPFPRPSGMCGNTAFELAAPHGLVLGGVWGLWKAWRVLIKS